MHSFIIAGLGNPGKPYVNTRHNIGYQVVEAFAKEHQTTWEQSKPFKAEIAKIKNDCSGLLVKPQRFMNLSGVVLQQVCSFYKIEPKYLIVIQDDIAIQKGDFKITISLGAGGHNGIANIVSCLGASFTRFRVGIGQKPIPEMDLKDYVLGDLTTEEKTLFSLKFPEYINALKFLVLQGSTAAMNKFNKRV
jgi:PTH1 family peptidyl-tRNA hydrolase